VNDEIMTAKDIADYFKLKSADVIARTAVNRPDFPKPLVFSGRGQGKRLRRRWFRDEVERWFRESYRREA